MRISDVPVTFQETENFIISLVQHDVYNYGIQCIRGHKPVPRGSPLQSLGPVMDTEGTLRVGGRLNRLKSDDFQKNPVIIPGSHHIATLQLRHHHQLLSHQGRHLTEGAVRSAGLWIIGGKRLVSSVIFSCITCKACRSTNGWSYSRQDRASTTLYICRCGRLRPLVDRNQKNAWWKRFVKAMGGPIYMLGDKSRPHRDSRFPLLICIYFCFA